ncbi:MAG: xanthine dehydrogenase family protein molybdopterin-binding subunit [Pseudomonadota bacterium]
MTRDSDIEMLQVGDSAVRPDAVDKVCGRLRYAADAGGPGWLWAGVRRAGIAHGKLVAVHSEKALAMSGVVAVLTHADVAGTNRQGVVRKDQPVLVDARVRHCGDAVALVVAESPDTLARAVAAVGVDIDPLPGVFDMDDALCPDAPRIHDDHPGGNVLLQGSVVTGSGIEAFADCAAVAELSLSLPWQEHAYLETECGHAVWRDDGGLFIEASTQTPFRDRAEVSEALGVDPVRVRISAPCCGGAFGGKDGITVQSLLGLAALHCPGRTVKMIWSREESVAAGVKRHAARLHYRLGALADGTLHALEATILFDTGPYDHLGGVVAALGLEHAGGPYRIAHTCLEVKSVYTNNPVSGAFRGFGVPQVAAAMEQAVDLVAERLNISPLAIRRTNALGKGDRTPIGATLTTSTGMSHCLETLAVHPRWTQRAVWKAAAGAFKRRGVGVAAVMHGMGYGTVVPDVANAKIALTVEGRFRVYSGVVDMGQGNGATYLQIAGDLLNQDAGRMELVQPDTDRTLPSGSSSASRTTYTYANALILAAGQLKARILQRAADFLMASGASEMALVPGAACHLPSGRMISLDRLSRALCADERVAVARWRAPVSREHPVADDNLRLHGIPHLVFSFAAHLAAVEVDLLTGAVKVADYLAVSDCGRIINPQRLAQQMHGGIAQGLGYALMEELIVDQGRVDSRDLATYLVPTAMDVPPMEALAIALHEHTGPFGLKGAGELAIDAPLPAVANAVADACGIRVAQFPMTAERVLAQLALNGMAP